MSGKHSTNVLDSGDTWETFRHKEIYIVNYKLLKIQNNFPRSNLISKNKAVSANYELIAKVI